MKLITAFLKDKGREISLYAGTVGIFVVVAFLYNIRIDELRYALLLVAVWLLLYEATEFCRFRKKHLILESLRKVPQECVDNLPQYRNLLEADYQEIITMLSEKLAEIKSEDQIARQDLADYYGMWAHQIKTPIAAMHILLQGMEAEYPELTETKEIKMELFKMEQYVEMVLTYLRMEDMSSDLQIEQVPLDKILKQSVRKYSQMFILQKIRLEYQPTGQNVLTDEKGLGFVIEQILSNALKYTMQGEIHIYAREDKNGLQVVISDTGIGIKREDLPRLFERGFTGYNGRMDKKASGLGLYLCKGICNKLGHQIFIESEVGKGTQVIIQMQYEKLNHTDLTKM